MCYNLQISKYNIAFYETCKRICDMKITNYIELVIYAHVLATDNVTSSTMHFDLFASMSGVTYCQIQLIYIQQLYYYNIIKN